jgi:hypothetical protein
MPLTRFHACCDTARPSLFGRGVAAAKWIGPSLILALLPKCPLCFAAYVALVTGIGVSISTAAYLNYGLVVLCVGSLLYLIATSFKRFRKKAFRPPSSPRM